MITEKLKKTYENNAVKRIQLHKKGSTWMFNDEYLELIDESFVCGASECIQFIIDNHPTLINKKNPVIIFSANKFPNYDAKIDLVEDMKPSGTYKMDLPGGQKMDLWLCSVANSFFGETLPESIYIQFINN